MRTLQLQLNKIDDALCVKILIGAVVFTAFMYVYMVNSIAFNASSYQSVVKSASILQSQIGQLESSLIAENRKIEKSLAVEFGLSKTVENEANILVRESNTRLTLNE
jgi:serine protease inhibitor ecotin